MRAIIKIERNEVLLADRGLIASSFFSRARGLIGRSSFEPGEALVLERCKSVHMFFMRFPIDVVFCSEQGIVVQLIECLRPWTVSGYFPKASFVVELPSGTLCDRDLQVGDRLLLETEPRAGYE